MSSRSDTRTTRLPLPKSADQVAVTVETLIAQGGLVRLDLLFEEGLVRVIEKVSGDVPFEEETSWDGALRNVEMEEYSSPGAESFQVVVDMMLLISHRRCHPAQWVTGVGGEALIEKWLELDERGMPVKCDQLMGVPLIELKSLPEETLVLCGSRYPDAGPEEVSFAVKTTVELRRYDVQHGKADDRRGNGSRECDSATGEMEAITTALRLPKWNL